MGLIIAKWTTIEGFKLQANRGCIILISVHVVYPGHNDQIFTYKQQGDNLVILANFGCYLFILCFSISAQSISFETKKSIGKPKLCVQINNP